MGLMAGLSGLKDFAFLPPFRAAIELLITIPGISHLSAEVLVSEMGIDMSRFETAGHLVSWAGLCPSNDQSAGKRRSTRMKKGAPWLKTTLIQCAWAATRKKDGYLQAQFLRLRTPRRKESHRSRRRLHPLRRLPHA
jgi:transposase